MPRGVRPWNKALNSLDFKHYRYRYFTLKNPPDKPSGGFKDKFGHEANKSYEAVQENIQELADLLVSQQQGQIGRQMYVSTLKLLEERRNDSIAMEQRLFTSLLKDGYNINEGVSRNLYLQLVDNTLKTNAEPNNIFSSFSWEQVKQMTTIEVWTRMANSGFNLQNENFKGIELTEQEFGEAALSYICQSTDIYDALKSDKEMSFFSRHLALKGDKEQITNANISPKAMKVFAKAFENWSKELAPEVSKYLSDVVYRTLSNWFNVRKTSKGYSMGAYKKTSQAPLASSVSTTLRSNLTSALASLQNDPLLKGKTLPTQIRLENSEGKTFFYVSIPLKDEAQDFYSAMRRIFVEETGSDFVKRNNFKEYLQEHPEGKELLITTFFKILKQGILKMGSKNVKELHLLSLGTFSIESFINAQGNEKLRHKDVKDFYNAAAMACSGNRIMETLFSSKELVDSAYQSFVAANSNAFLSGLLGEISALFNVNKIIKMKGQMTGTNVFSAINGYSSFGQSVNDLKYKYKFKEDGKRKQSTFGVNVKHYATSKNEIELYKSERGISVFKNTINKYLGYEDTLILRFMLENSRYFSKSDIKSIGKRIAFKHLPEFYRVYDHDKHSVKNLFYILNNVCYPSSYIYNCIIEKLKQDNKGLDKLLTFSTKTMPSRIPSKYDNYSEAIQAYRDEDWRLQNKRQGNLDGSIKVNGLKINLVNLNLF